MMKMLSVESHIASVATPTNDDDASARIPDQSLSRQGVPRAGLSSPLSDPATKFGGAEVLHKAAHARVR